MPQTLPAPVDDHPRVSIRLLQSLNKSEHSQRLIFLVFSAPVERLVVSQEPGKRSNGL